VSWRNFREVIEKICATAIAVCLGRTKGTPPESREPWLWCFLSSSFTAGQERRSHKDAAYIGKSMSEQWRWCRQNRTQPKDARTVTSGIYQFWRVDCKATTRAVKDVHVDKRFRPEGRCKIMTYVMTKPCPVCKQQLTKRVPTDTVQCACGKHAWQG